MPTIGSTILTSSPGLPFSDQPEKLYGSSFTIADAAALAALNTAALATGTVVRLASDKSQHEWNGTAFVAIGTAVNEVISATTMGSVFALKNGQYLRWLPAATGVVNIDVANVQGFFNSISSMGGIVIVPENYALPYEFGANIITIPVPVKMVGAGGRYLGDASDFPPKSASTFNFDSATTGGFLVTADGGCVFEDFSITNKSATTPTAGTGLAVTTNANMLAMRGVSIANFWNNADIRGQYYTVDSCHFFDYANYGVLLKAPSNVYYDHGDQGIVNCAFIHYFQAHGGNSAVRWESGGGLRFTGNKINGGYQVGNPSAGYNQYGLDISVESGCNTGVFMITGNSLENCLVAQLRIRPQQTSVACIVERVIISGNELFGAGVGCQIGTGGAAFTGYNFTRQVVIGDNTFSTGLTPIEVTSMNGLTVGINDYNGSFGTWTGAIDISGYGRNINVLGGQMVLGGNKHLVNDRRRINTDMAGDLSGDIRRETAQALKITAADVWTTVGWVTMGSDTGAAGTLEVTVSGINGATGQFLGVYQKSLICAAGTSTVTVGNIAADYTTGAGQVSVQFLTTTAGRVTIQVKVNLGATDPNFYGIVNIEAKGIIQQFHQGN
jgi:hypothetical protein